MAMHSLLEALLLLDSLSILESSICMKHVQLLWELDAFIVLHSPLLDSFSRDGNLAFAPCSLGFAAAEVAKWN